MRLTYEKRKIKVRMMLGTGSFYAPLITGHLTADFSVLSRSLCVLS